jgi:hypothetical protein
MSHFCRDTDTGLCDIIFPIIQIPLQGWMLISPKEIKTKSLDQVHVYVQGQSHKPFLLPIV